MSVKRKILENLDGRVYPINELCATIGLGDKESTSELKVMVSEGIVELNMIKGMPLYRLTWKGRNLLKAGLQLVVDNSSKLM